MTAAPPLLQGRRRGLAAALVGLAMGEALLAVLFATRLDHLLAQSGPAPAAVGIAGVIAVAAAGAMLLQRWVGELFAQAYVADCRAAVFAALARRRGAAETGADARWLTALINDMASLRNYALRGTVRLWTGATAAGAASLWVAAAIPPMRIGLVPLALSAGAILLLTVPLSRAIIAQRRERGRLNRFMVRRVQAERGDSPAPKGHGFRKLASLSEDLSRMAVQRAAGVGAMESAASLGGLVAALLLVWQARSIPSAPGIAGHLTLVAFIAARLLDVARALHARIGGKIALERLADLIASVPLPKRNRPARRQRKRTSGRRETERTRAEPILLPLAPSTQTQEPAA